MMNKIIIMAMASLLALTATAQNNQRRERQNNFDITEIYNRQANRLVRTLKLNDEQKGKFTVLYLDYQNARHNAANPNGGDQEGAEQRVDFEKLTDVQATELIQKNFDRQEKQLAVDREYLPKFLEILTPAQAAQVFLQRGGNGRPLQMGNGGGGNRGGGGRGGFGGPGGGGFGGPGGGF